MARGAGDPEAGPRLEAILILLSSTGPSHQSHSSSPPLLSRTLMLYLDTCLHFLGGVQTLFHWIVSEVNTAPRGRGRAVGTEPASKSGCTRRTDGLLQHAVERGAQRSDAGQDDVRELDRVLQNDRGAERIGLVHCEAGARCAEVIGHPLFVAYVPRIEPVGITVPDVARASSFAEIPSTFLTIWRSSTSTLTLRVPFSFLTDLVRVQVSMSATHVLTACLNDVSSIPPFTKSRVTGPCTPSAKGNGRGVDGV